MPPDSIGSYQGVGQDIAIRNPTPTVTRRPHAGWLVIALVGAAQVLSSVVVNACVFHGRIGALLGDLHAATGGLVHPNLVANLVPLLLVVGVVIFAVGRVKPADIGWARSKLVPALIVTLAFWALSQVVLVVIAASGENGIALDQSWRLGAGAVIGALLGQLFGNALAEETVFRGFLFTQLYYKFGQRLGRVRALVIAALVSQVAFAVVHLPNRLLVKGVPGSELLGDRIQLVVMGLVFLAIYAVTRNLFIAVGLHALANVPASVIQTSNSTAASVWLALTVALIVLWIPARQLLRRRTVDQPPAANS